MSEFVFFETYPGFGNKFGILIQVFPKGFNSNPLLHSIPSFKDLKRRKNKIIISILYFYFIYVYSIFYPIFCIMHSSTHTHTHILYHVSCILYPVSCLMYPVSCILYPVSCILYPVNTIFTQFKMIHCILPLKYLKPIL